MCKPIFIITIIIFSASSKTLASLHDSNGFEGIHNTRYDEHVEHPYHHMCGPQKPMFVGWVLDPSSMVSNHHILNSGNKLFVIIIIFGTNFNIRKNFSIFLLA